MPYVFEVDESDMPPVKQGKVRRVGGRPIPFGKGSCYCGLAAEIGPNLETTYHVKIGWTCTDMVKRCNAQRLKLVWGISERCYSEVELQTKAEKMFGKIKTSYGQAGCTEMFGNFESSEEANSACLRLLETLRAEGWDVWVHPKAILPECST